MLQTCAGIGVLTDSAAVLDQAANRVEPYIDVEGRPVQFEDRRAVGGRFIDERGHEAGLADARVAAD